MSNIEKIRQEIERRKEELERDKYINIDAKACRHSELKFLERFIDSLPEETSYDINKLTPTPSVNIEDVSRVQFASHAHVFDRKRKAVFDWEQFKEVAGIFYGFGKRDSLPEEKLSEDLEEAAEELFETIEIQEHENIFEDTFKKIFIAGAEWQRKQLLKK